MKLYQGVDIVDIARFTRTFQGRDDLMDDVFSKEEQTYCSSKQNPFVHLAGRFAAKEAVLKALGIGMSGSGLDSSLRDIEVIHHASGKPSLNFRGWIETLSRKKSVCQRTLSISHSGNYAVATVILMGKDKV